MRSTLFIAVFMFCASVWTVDSTAQTQTPEQTTNQAGNAEEELQAAAVEPPVAAGAGNELILADIDEEETQDDAQSNRRFIPTEEISQDLGVSFPVDI